MSSAFLRAVADRKADARPAQCIYCLSSDPVPVSAGCGCRGDAGLVHPGCKVAFAESRGISDPHLWLCCATCNQPHGRNEVSAALGARWWELLNAAVPGPGLDEMNIMMNKTLAGQVWTAVLMEQGRTAEAEAVMRHVDETEAALEQGMNCDDDDPLTAFMRGYSQRTELAEALEDEDRFAESEPVYRKLIEEGTALLAQPGLSQIPQNLKAGLDIMVLRATRDLGNSLACQAAQGRSSVHDEGERLLRVTQERFRLVLGPAHPESLTTTVRLAQCLALRGGPQAAELLRACMPKLLASSHPMLPLAQQLLSMMQG